MKPKSAVNTGGFYYMLLGGYCLYSVDKRSVEKVSACVVTQSFAYNARSAGIVVFAPTTSSAYKHRLHRLTTPHTSLLRTSSSQHTPSHAGTPSMCLYKPQCTSTSIASIRLYELKWAWGTGVGG